MKLLKKIIREQLEKVLSNLSEGGFYKGLDYDKLQVKSNPKTDIIYDYEKGRIFAEDTLAVDIVSLNRYNLIEYLPKSISEESWSFEFETVYKTILIVDIKREVKNNRNFWSLKFGQLYRDEQLPSLIAEIERVEGYENFVSEVNKNISPKIDPSKY